MAQWGNSDSGILRKTKTTDNLEELLVFGYSCKIFRDDEKALYIDQGKHLIPWMGDDNLKIDRYDCRGALSDLKKYEANREGYDATRWLGLSESERKLEELCDNERYYSLEINEEEEEMYKEEVFKREKTNTFAFNYDNPPPPQETEQKEGIPTVPEREEEEKPYIPLPILDVPVDVIIPTTLKEYARIEKTALFVCHQGPQMEILIKAKQADNPQFSFLIVNDPLYKFYRHVLSAFKNGRYQPQCDKKLEPNAIESQHADQNTHYLHPSLSASAKSETPTSSNLSIPSVPYRPSADCAYSQLVNRIQGTGQTSSGQLDLNMTAVNQQSESFRQMGASNTHMGDVANQIGVTLEQQYYHYYYVQQWYDYWRHAVLNGEQGAVYANLPDDFNQLDPNMQNYIHQMAWAQYMQQHKQTVTEVTANNNSYAQIVSNLNKDVVNPYTANMPRLPPQPENVEPVQTNLQVEEHSKIKQPLLSLAADYGSGTDTSDSETSESEEENSKTNEQKQVEVYSIPTGETQVVIDKMADYVLKNGAQFEEIIKAKNDARFEFLKDGHEFYQYYRTKLGQLKGETDDKEAKKEEKKQSKPKKIIAPVSFSIKKTKEEPTKEIKSALPVEDSSDEDNNKDNSSRNSPNSKAMSSVAIATQKAASAPKLIYKLSQATITPLQQPIVGEISYRYEENGSNASKTEPTPTTDNLVSPRRQRRLSNSPLKHIKQNSKSPDSSPPWKNSRSPKKRSKSPEKSSDVRSHSKSSKEKQSRKNKKTVIDMFEVESNGVQEQKEVMKNDDVTLVNDDPILEMIELEEKCEDKSADEKEKALQLERKRKAAMFLKLKSAESNINTAVQKEKHESSSRKKSPLSEKSRRNSQDSTKSERSRERSRTKETEYSRGSSRSSCRSRSREKKRDYKKQRKGRDRSRTPKDRREGDKKRRKEKKKKSHKRKRSQSRSYDARTKKKQKKHHKRSKSRSLSVSKSETVSRSKSSSLSRCSHISIDSS